MISTALNKRYQLFILLFIILISRLPFLVSGYGADADAWRIVQSGYNLYSNGIYHPSRFPGYPIPEFMSGAIWLSGLPFIIPRIFNFVSALFSIIGIYYFILISKRFLNTEGYAFYLPIIAFAFIPVFYINSTGMMDYNWALAFILGSVYFLISGRIILSALFLALAAGCRITSSLFLIPIVYYLICSAENNSRGRKITEYVLIFLVVTFILFLPLIVKYGITFLSFDRPPAQYSLIKIIGRITIRTWGVVGSLGILVSFIVFFLNKKRVPGDLFVKNKMMIFFLISIMIYLILFFTLPLDAGYLIPIVPFVILFLYRVLSGKVLIFLSVLLIVSPFVLNIEKNNITLAGPIIINANKRISEEKYINKVINRAKSFDRPGLIICESFFPKIQVTIELKKVSVPAYVNFVYMISSDSLKSIVQRKNPQIFYLKNVRDETLKIYNYDLESFGAKEIL